MTRKKIIIQFVQFYDIKSNIDRNHKDGCDLFVKMYFTDVAFFLLYNYM